MLLLPALLAANSPARVVNVTSLAHTFAPAEGITFEQLKESKKPSWFPPRAFTERYRYYGEVILRRVVNLLWTHVLTEQTCELTCKKAIWLTTDNSKGQYFVLQ